MRKIYTIICTNCHKQHLIVNQVFTSHKERSQRFTISIGISTNASSFLENNQLNEHSKIMQSSAYFVEKVIVTTNRIFTKWSLNGFMKYRLHSIFQYSSSLYSRRKLDLLQRFNIVLSPNRNERMMKSVNVGTVFRLVQLNYYHKCCYLLTSIKKNIFSGNIVYLLTETITSVLSYTFIPNIFIFYAQDKHKHKFHSKAKWFHKLIRSKKSIRQLCHTLMLLVLPVLVYRVNVQSSTLKKKPFITEIIEKCSESCLMSENSEVFDLNEHNELRNLACDTNVQSDYMINDTKNSFFLGSESLPNIENQSLNLSQILINNSLTDSKIQCLYKDNVHELIHSAIYSLTTLDDLISDSAENKHTKIFPNSQSITSKFALMSANDIHSTGKVVHRVINRYYLKNQSRLSKNIESFFFPNFIAQQLNFEFISNVIRKVEEAIFNTIAPNTLRCAVKGLTIEKKPWLEVTKNQKKEMLSLRGVSFGSDVVSKENKYLRLQQFWISLFNDYLQGNHRIRSYKSKFGNNLPPNYSPQNFTMIDQCLILTDLIDAKFLSKAVTYRYQSRFGSSHDIFKKMDFILCNQLTKSTNQSLKKKYINTTATWQNNNNIIDLKAKSFSNNLLKFIVPKIRPRFVNQLKACDLTQQIKATDSRIKFSVIRNLYKKLVLYYQNPLADSQLQNCIDNKYLLTTEFLNILHKIGDEHKKNGQNLISKKFHHFLIKPKYDLTVQKNQFRNIFPFKRHWFNKEYSQNQTILSESKMPLSSVFWIPLNVLDLGVSSNVNSNQEWDQDIKEKLDINDEKQYKNSKNPIQLNYSDWGLFQRLKNFKLMSPKETWKKYSEWGVTREWWAFGRHVLQNSHHNKDQNNDYIYLNIKRIGKPHLNNQHEKYSMMFEDVLHKTTDFGCFHAKTISSSLDYVQHITNIESISFIFVIGVLYSHHIVTSIGLTYLILWKRMEFSRQLLNPSWSKQLQILLYNRHYSSPHTARYEKYAHRSVIDRIRVFKYSMFTLINLMPFCWVRPTTSDLPPQTKGILMGIMWKLGTNSNTLHLNNQYEQTSVSICSQQLFETHRTDHSIKYRNIQGLLSSRNVEQIAKKQSLFSQFGSTSHSSKLSKSFFSRPMVRDYKSNFNEYYLNGIPLPISLASNKHKNLLLIGPKETGKRYFAAKLALNMNVSFVEISFDQIIKLATRNQNTILFTRQQIWNRISLIFHSIKTLGPCILFLKDIDKPVIDVRTRIALPEISSYAILCRCFQIFAPQFPINRKQQIVLIASTYNVKQLDPVLIHPDKFNNFIYIRPCDISQRQQFFVNFIRNKGFYASQSFLADRLGHITMGYSWRDLVGFANETLLIGITQRRHSINSNSFALEKHRKVISNAFPSSRIGFLEKGIVYYEIGQVIVRNTLANQNRVLSSSLFINMNSELLKARFYLLSKTYLECLPNSNLTELTILPQILQCISGTASRDAWILAKVSSKEHLFNLTCEIQHNLSLASGLITGILTEFANLNLYRQKKCQDKFHLDAAYMLHRVFIYEYLQIKTKQIFMNNSLPINYFNHSLHFVKKTSMDKIHWNSRIKRFQTSPGPMFELPINKMKNTWARGLFHDVIDASSRTIFNKGITQPCSLQDELEGNRLVPYRRNAMRVRIKQESNAFKATLNFIISNQIMPLSDAPSNFMSISGMQPMSLNSSIMFISGTPVYSNTDWLYSQEVTFKNRDLFVDANVLSFLYTTYRSRREYYEPNTTLTRKVAWLKVIYPTASQKNPFYSMQSIAQESVPYKRPLLCSRAFFYQTISKKVCHVEYLHSRRLSQHQHTLTGQELSVYQVLLESYHYLLQMFLIHSADILKIEQLLLQ